MKLWLDSNISLDLTRDAIAAIERVLRAWPRDAHHAEIETAANIIRAHLQHVTEEPGLAISDAELLA